MKMDFFKRSMNYYLSLLLIYLIDLGFGKPLPQFQYQCYGVRTLCTFPDEFCSSEIQKCVPCSTGVCSNPGDIPLACKSFCEEGEEEATPSYLNPFVGVAVTAAILFIVIITLVVMLKRARDSLNKLQGTLNSPPASRNSTISRGLSGQDENQPLNGAETDNHYCNQKLKNVCPAQDPYAAYTPAP